MTDAAEVISGPDAKHVTTTAEQMLFVQLCALCSQTQTSPDDMRAMLGKILECDQLWRGMSLMLTAVEPHANEINNQLIVESAYERRGTTID